jgi:cellulose synthase/poly-beta-1,6-N-acetylglucosamine synthase-like glycosyltransferase
MKWILLSAYFAALAWITCFSFVQLSLVISYWRNRRKQARSTAATVDAEPATRPLPFVTIQLPVYNERYVIERLIDAVAGIDYPKDRFEIQVLDDSTDETTSLIAAKIEALNDPALPIRHVRRASRAGFKAGALAEGLKQARGEFIAIFDADFLPRPDFLQRTIPHFTDPAVGMVQTRWEHLNADYSALTQMQALFLDMHFTVEQRGRNAAGHFINFNGTGGVWRKRCIEDAGGWQSDTLTEDLDLSYRAQLKGWKFQYLENLDSPAELPVEMNAYKTQQFRWTKGAAECARKHWLRVLRDRSLDLGTKLHALFHLGNSSLFVCSLLLAVLSVPVLYFRDQSAAFDRAFQWTSYFSISSVLLTLLFWTAFQGAARERRVTASQAEILVEFLKRFPVFLVMTLGMTLHNSIAVIEGYLGRKTPFIRTPKFNVVAQTDSGWRANQYLSAGINWLTVAEFGMLLYFLGAIGLAFWLKNYSMLTFHLMLVIGFGAVVGYSVRHGVRAKG